MGRNAFSLGPRGLRVRIPRFRCFSKQQEAKGIRKVFQNWPLEGEAGLGQIRFFLGAPKPQGENSDAPAFLKWENIGFILFFQNWPFEGEAGLRRGRGGGGWLPSAPIPASGRLCKPLGLAFALAFGPDPGSEAFL